ncbi:MAG: AraC family transcriptional regulator [Myxococcales bacterium]|nr:MAG: AraC family transcriptional regulator [Myxococcales bacterium]
MDALSAVLAPVRLQRTVWASTVGRAPWGLSVPASRNCVRFHYLLRGSAWLSLDKTDERVALAGGDLAVMPLGHGHVLRDQPGSTPSRWVDVARCATRPTRAVLQIAIGARGPETTFISGAFVLDDPLARSLLATLPPLIRMTPDAEQVPSFLENIQFITREVEADRPGSDIVLLRMADVIFIQILRAYLARSLDDGGGFLGALRDPGTAAALGAMHHRPEAPWTVASLAREVGLSRSVFAARFTSLVGEPPLGYLTRLRMQRATSLLRDGATLARVSRLTGYASEASFSHAFRQWAGVAPGTWRRQLKAPPA